ncbi:MAG: hypothetical protein U0S12_01645 [Fimbriimonadales bacterium]
MRITDYETRKSLNDVSLTLTRDEAEELAVYLERLLSNPEVERAHLSEVANSRLERELTVQIAPTLSYAHRCA